MFVVDQPVLRLRRADDVVVERVARERASTSRCPSAAPDSASRRSPWRPSVHDRPENRIHCTSSARSCPVVRLRTRIVCQSAPPCGDRVGEQPRVRRRRERRERGRRVRPEDVRIDQLRRRAVESLAHVERRLLLHAGVHPVEQASRFDDRQIGLAEVPQPRDPPLKMRPDRLRAQVAPRSAVFCSRDPRRHLGEHSGPRASDTDRQPWSRGSRRPRHPCESPDTEASV